MLDGGGIYRNSGAGLDGGQPFAGESRHLDGFISEGAGVGDLPQPADQDSSPKGCEHYDSHTGTCEKRQNDAGNPLACAMVWHAFGDNTHECPQTPSSAE